MAPRLTDDEAAAFAKGVALAWFWPSLYKFIFSGLVWAGANLLLLALDEDAYVGSNALRALSEFAGEAGFLFGVMAGATVFLSLTGPVWARAFLPPRPTRH